MSVLHLPLRILTLLVQHFICQCWYGAGHGCPSAPPTMYLTGSQKTSPPYHPSLCCGSVDGPCCSRCVGFAKRNQNAVRC
ncbi:hypothetical protein AA0121_g13530 [Alternaria tenuissima]|nr:hypothetical protein AA0121_g13530 [Alternaria tenuissima]